jgi:hypothetical protein
MLSKDELNALINRKRELEVYIKSGGGIFAIAECAYGAPACDGRHMIGISSSQLYSFLPVKVSSIPPTPPFTGLQKKKREKKKIQNPFVCLFF